jgi:hypothetical protein
MDAPERYLEELRSELSAYPTWLPTDGIELGSFGGIVDGRFVSAGRLADLDIPVESTEPPPGQSFKKQRGMKLTTGSATLATFGAFDLSVDVSFEATSAYSWAFAARGARKIEVKNILEVNRLIVEAYKAGTWERNWCLVTAVWRVDRLTLLVARSKQVTARAHAKGTVAEPFDVLLEETATFQYASDDFFCVPGAKDVTPLYGLHKLQGVLGKHLRGISRDIVAAPFTLETTDDEPFFAAR